MANSLSDQGELEVLRRAYAGETLTVGLYNETGDIPDYTRTIGEDDPDNDPNIIDSVEFNFFIGGSSETEVEDDQITATQGSSLSHVAQTEPERTLSYSRQEVEIQQGDIKQVFGFKDTTDLSVSLEVPKVEFNVSTNSREINAVFVANDGELLFTAFLPQDYVLDDKISVKVTNVKLLLE